MEALGLRLARESVGRGLLMIRWALSDKYGVFGGRDFFPAYVGTEILG
jgi:hypothetical protein